MATETYTLRPRPAAAAFRIDYAAELNPAQLAAVEHGAGPMLVVAGAGSGKTRTLVYRVARLVEGGASPRSILLLTFTRRAAESMLDRASDLVGAEAGRVAGGTFHSFSNLVMRRHAEEVGLEQGFTILDRSDSEDVIHLLRTELGLDRKERRFPKKQTIADLLSTSVNRDRTLAELVEEDAPHLSDHLEDLGRLAVRFVEFKRERALLDYDDLLVRLRDALRERPLLVEALRRTYRHVLVDEYQDTNKLQAEIVERLAGADGNVVAVGDDAQSIYAFRGADVRNILDFPKRFPGAKIVALEQNYRSTRPILDLANAVIERATERYTKILFTERGGEDRPLLVEADTENYQSRFLVQRILDLREEGVPLGEIAVLFRSSAHSFDLEIELARAGVPFVKRGGFRFVESAHVKDVLAHLRLAVNPRDVVSWLRVLGLLEGVGPKKAGEIARFVQESGRGPAALRDFPKKGAWSGSLAALADMIPAIGAPGVRPSEAIERVARWYQPILERLHADDHPKRARDLDHLVGLATRYRVLEGMLSDFALEPPSDSVGGNLAGDDGDPEPKLVLSTIHSAKGLEWKVVFVLWVVEGRFPGYYSTLDDDEIEEERRLCYVAVTRAKDQLYLCAPRRAYDRVSGIVETRPSRFVEGLSERLLAPVTIVEEF